MSTLGNRFGYAKAMRRKMTPPERMLWDAIRNRRIDDVKFRRQHPFGRFILDFYSVELQLAIEVDGGIHLHDEQRAYDAWRDEMVRSQNLTVLRFTNEQVLTDLGTVLDAITAETQRLKTTRTPLPGGEGQG